MLTVEITSMPAASSSSMSCQRFSLRQPGHVGVRELVDERDLGRAGEHRVDVHLLERWPAVLDLLARDDLEVADLLARCAVAPWVSTKPTTTSVPRSWRRRPSLSIAKVLPTPGAAPR